MTVHFTARFMCSPPKLVLQFTLFPLPSHDPLCSIQLHMGISILPNVLICIYSHSLHNALYFSNTFCHFLVTVLQEIKCVQKTVIWRHLHCFTTVVIKYRIHVDIDLKQLMSCNCYVY